jgi:hypothetical protein
MPPRGEALTPDDWATGISSATDRLAGAITRASAEQAVPQKCDAAAPRGAQPQLRKAIKSEGSFRSTTPPASSSTSARERRPRVDSARELDNSRLAFQLGNRP